MTDLDKLISASGYKPNIPRLSVLEECHAIDIPEMGRVDHILRRNIQICPGRRNIATIGMRRDVAAWRIIVGMNVCGFSLVLGVAVKKFVRLARRRGTRREPRSVAEQGTSRTDGMVLGVEVVPLEGRVLAPHIDGLQ
jgi:hypothetical protein